MYTIRLMATKEINRILLSILCLILLLEPSYSQTDKLFGGQLLKDGDQLFSAFGKFRLGFFSAVCRTNRYLGIWYFRPQDNYGNVRDCRESGLNVDSPSYQPVWVANRNAPILDKSGSLTIDSIDGNLKILHQGGDPIVISSILAAGNTSATLEESGNFVLYEMYSNGSRRKLWQSFDYPTDTLLPGMKLGINLQTGHQWFLQSWMTYDSPAQGSFILGMDPNVTNQLMIWWEGEAFRICVLSSKGEFICSYAQSYSNSYNFSYTTTEQEIYFSYSVDDHVISFPVLTISSYGDLTDHIGSFSTNYQENYRNCSEGFSTFWPKGGFMSGEGFKFNEIDNMTLNHCKAKCLKNCSCIACASTNRNNGTGCEIWSRGTNFIESSSINPRQIYVEKVQPEVTQTWSTDAETKKKWWWPKLIIGGGAAILVAVLCFLCYRIRRKYKAKEENWWHSLGVVLVVPMLCHISYLISISLKTKVESIWNRWKLLHELGDNISVSLPITFGKLKAKDKDQKHELKIYDFQVIAAATNCFSATNKLGQGVFGTVYKGKLPDGQEITIKKLSKSSGQGITEFKNEAKLIAKLQHTNLVRLLGCSLHGGERILVYEYMANKSLDFFLFDSDRKNLLNLKKRHSIIEGIVQGLIYLHKYSRLKVIHRDMKASNILLDDQMNPKISDFGMARAFGVNEIEANTKRIVGTHGYMSPKYIMNGIVSMKTDVYSFGVMVLEIMSSKKNNDCYDTDRPLNLVGYAWQLWNEGRGLELIYQSMDESCSDNEVLRCVHVGLLCVQDRATDRPTMSEVVFMLTNENMVLPPPKQPAFFINITSEEPEVPRNNLENCSANIVTISEMKAR